MREVVVNLDLRTPEPASAGRPGMRFTPITEYSSEMPLNVAGSPS